MKEYLVLFTVLFCFFNNYVLCTHAVDSMLLANFNAFWEIISYC